MSGTLVEQVRQDADASRAAALVQYREILARNDSPQEGDVEALRRLFPVLGKTPVNLCEDFFALAQARALEERAANLADLDAKALAAGEALREEGAKRDEVVKTADAQLAQVVSTWRLAEAASHAAQRAASDLAALKRQRPDLFGLPPEPPAQPEEPPGSGAVGPVVTEEQPAASPRSCGAAGWSQTPGGIRPLPD